MRAIDPSSAMGREALPAGRYYIKRLSSYLHATGGLEVRLVDGPSGPALAAPSTYQIAAGALLLEAPSGMAADSSATIIMKNIEKENGEHYVPKLTCTSYVPACASESGSSFHMPLKAGVVAWLTLRATAASDANGDKILVGYYTIKTGEAVWDETAHPGESEWCENVRCFRASDATDDWPLD